MKKWKDTFTRTQRSTKLHRLHLLLVAILFGSGLPIWVGSPVLAQDLSKDPNREIIYIEKTSGIIKVYDYGTLAASTAPRQVQWQSPDGGYREIATGDVNNDKDAEIIAIRGEIDNGRLIVFDPVVAKGASNLTQRINEIPWDKLVEFDVQGKPLVVGAGNFDPAIPGDEIAYVVSLKSTNKRRLVILKGSSITPTGRDWVVHATFDFDENPTQLAVGNMVDSNPQADEIALVDNSRGILKVLRVDGGLRVISPNDLGAGSADKPWQRVAFGDYYAGGTQELAAVRRVSFQLDGFYIFQYVSDGNFAAPVTDKFNPVPGNLFFADINPAVTADDELFMLREAPDPFVRMIVRGSKTGNVPTDLEQRLDTGYGTGAGGDIDGDGKDELVLMRNEKFRIFYQPDGQADPGRTPGATQSTDVALQNDDRNLRIADLDYAGFTFGPQLSVAGSQIVNGKLEVSVPYGQESAHAKFTITNIGTADPIGFNVTGIPDWMRFVTSTGGRNTPDEQEYFFTTLGFGIGKRAAAITVQPVDATIKAVTIPVTLTVTAAQLKATPDVVAIAATCSPSATVKSATISLTGANGVSVTGALLPPTTIAQAEAALAGSVTSAAVQDGVLTLTAENGQSTTLAWPTSTDAPNITWLSGVNWATVEASSNVFPTNVTITVKPNTAGLPAFSQADLFIVGDAAGGRPVLLVPVILVCYNTQTFLPTVLR